MSEVGRLGASSVRVRVGEDGHWEGLDPSSPGSSSTAAPRRGAPHSTTPMRKPSLPEKRHTSPPHVRVLRPCGWAPGMSGGFKSLGQASFLSGPPRGPVLRFSEAHANLHARPMGPTTPTGRPSMLGAPPGVFRPARLLADAEAADERPVPLRALAPEVVEQAAALTDELEKT